MPPPILPALPEVLANPIFKATDLVRQVTGGLTWGPLLAVARPAILSLFAQVEIGTLLLFDEPTGRRLVYGQKLGPKDDELTNGPDGIRRATTIPRVELIVRNDSFWVRSFLFADMGFAESYMLGEVECADLTAFFQVRNYH